MTNMERSYVTWTGQSGLPGVSVFYGEVGGSLNSDLKTFFTAIRGGFVNTLSWGIPSSGDLIDDVTGALTGTWSNPAGGGTVTGQTSGAYAAGVGAYVNWNTGVVVGRRRLMGRTFLTNMSTAMYDAQGTIDAANLASFQAAVTALVATGDLLVWHRPTGLGGNGESHVVQAGTMPDQVTSLRSRRR